MLAKFLPGNRGKDTPPVPPTPVDFMLRNRGSEAATVTFVHDGVESYMTVNPGGVNYMPYQVNYGKKVSEVYESVVATFPTSGKTVTYDVNKKVTERTLMIFEFTDMEHLAGTSIITVHNDDMHNFITVDYNILGVVSSITLDPNGSFDLPEPVTDGNALNSAYNNIEATLNGRIVYIADLSTVITNDTTLEIVPEIYWKVTTDMNGNAITDATTGDPLTIQTPIWVKDGMGLSDSINTAVYVQGNTYVPDAPGHAAEGQFGFYNGCTYDNGAAKYPFPAAPMEDVDLVCHTTYGYWTGFSCDCYDASAGYPGCSGVSDKSGEYIQYKWDDIVNALHDKYPNNDLVAVWADGSKQTQIQFTTQTVDYVEGLWSEPVVPAALSNVYLYLETSGGGGGTTYTLTLPDIIPLKVEEAFEPQGTGTGSVTFKPGLNVDNDSAASNIQDLYDFLQDGETDGEFTVEQTDGNTWQYYVADKSADSVMLKVDSETDNYAFDFSLVGQMGSIYFSDALASVPNDMVVEATPIGYTQVVVLGTSLSMIDLPSYANNIPTGTTCLLAQADNSEAKYVCEATVTSTVSGTPVDGDTITLTFEYEEDGNQYDLLFEGAYQDDGEGNIDFALNNVTANGFDKINNDWV